MKLAAALGGGTQAVVANLGCVLALVVGGALVGVGRTQAVAQYGGLRETSDSYALLDPEQLVVASLGHRSAVADLIYAHTLVSYGLHFGERRRFTHVGEYLEAITTLDPRFVEPYLFADTLLTLQAEPPRQEDYRRARELVLKGTRELPYNRDVWDTGGQYLSYLAPPHLEDEHEGQRWRREGAQLLARACELGGDDNASMGCVAAARVLNREGERDALIRMLSRTLAVNDDPTVKAKALAALRRWVGQAEHEKYEERARAFEQAWLGQIPYVTKERVLLLGPNFSPAHCSGLDQSEELSCATTWARWSELQRFQ